MYPSLVEIPSVTSKIRRRKKKKKLDGKYSERVQIPAKAIADFTVTLCYVTVRGYDSACKCKM